MLILDDQLVQRQGITHVVEEAPGMQVGATTGSSSEALDLISKQPFDLALVDLVLKNQRGTVIGRAMRRMRPELKVILYTHEKSMVLAADIFWERKELGEPGLQGYADREHLRQPISATGGGTNL